jgi:hypothetical protein
MSKRIHIVASGPRTGTTLLSEAMKVCFNFDIASEHETSLCISNSELGKSDLILTKYPFEFDIVLNALKLNRSLYVICLVRDPRDMVVSKHGAFPDQYWCSLRYWFLFMSYYERLKKNKQVLVIKYENLVTNPDETQRQIHEFLPFLKVKHRFSKFHIHAEVSELGKSALKGVRPIIPKGIGNWKNHLPRVKQQVKLHGQLEKSLIETGYEKDNEWVKVLSEVDEIAFKTKMDEFFPENMKMQRLIRQSIVIINALSEKFGIYPNLLLTPFRKLYRIQKKIF